MTGASPDLVLAADRLRAARHVVVASQVAVQAPAGSVVAVEGPNGSGKSTVLAAAAGLLPSATTSRRPSSVGFAPERTEVLPRMSVHRWLIGLARTAGLAPAAAAAEVDLVVDRLGLDPVRAQSMRVLSRGNVQRALVAQALLGPPALVVLDEPAGGLDRDGVRRVGAAVADAAAGGATVVVSRHPTAPLRLPAGPTWELADGHLQVHERGAERHAEQAWVRVRTSDGVVHEVPEAAVGAEIRSAFDAGLEVVGVEPMEAEPHSVGSVSRGRRGSAKPSGGPRASSASRVWQGALHRARLLAVSEWTTAPALLFLAVLAVVYATDAGSPVAAAALTAAALAPVLTWVGVMAHGVDGRPVARAFAAHVGGVGRAHLAADLAAVPFLLGATVVGTVWALVSQRHAAAHPPAVVLETAALLLSAGVLGVGLAAVLVPPLLVRPGWRVAVGTVVYALVLLVPVSPLRPMLELAVGQPAGGWRVALACAVPLVTGAALCAAAAVAARSRS